MSAGMAIDVRSNVKEIERKLSRFGRDQVPFATSLALNSTAFDLQRHTRERTYPSAFEVRNKSFPRLMTQVDKASKRDLKASVGAIKGNAVDRREILERQELGAVRRPKKARSLAVPSERVKLTSTGKIRQADKISSIFAKNKGFVIELRGGKGRAIFRRYGKKRGEIEPLYWLERSVTDRPIYKFERTSRAFVEREFPMQFERKLLDVLTREGFRGR